MKIKKYFPIILILLLAGLLRLIALDKYPAGLNADEAAIGYNAWSLIQTGKDEHSVSWPLVFRSFDDYKPPVYFYLVLPFVKILGLNVWAVRLPSAILGTLSVYLLYLLIKQIFPKIKYLPELCALILAVSPWHLQYSRGGWEVNASLFFILLGLYGFFKSLNKANFYFLFIGAFAASMYIYHSARIIAPLIGLTLIVVYWSDLKKDLWSPKLKVILAALVFGFLTCLPLAFQLLSKEGQSRFSGVSVFSDTGPLWQALELRRAHGDLNLYVKLIHNQYLSYGLRFVKNYLSHFSPRFLFVTGDEIARNKVPNMGESLMVLFVFYFAGLFELLKLDTRSKKFILLWFLIAPLAAALTFQSPHALRSQNMVIPFTVITALGVVSLLNYVVSYKVKILTMLFVFVSSLLFCYSTLRYLHQYYLHYPKELPFAWQYGFDQIAAYVKANYNHYDKIVITDRYDQPYILMAFFMQYPPAKLQKEIVMTPRDKFGFSTVRKLDKMEFRLINWGQDKLSPNTLIISADESVDTGQVIGTINDPNGQIMYKISSTK